MIGLVGDTAMYHECTKYDPLHIDNCLSERLNEHTR